MYTYTSVTPPPPAFHRGSIRPFRVYFLLHSRCVLLMKGAYEKQKNQLPTPDGENDEGVILLDAALQ